MLNLVKNCIDGVLFIDTTCGVQATQDYVERTVRSMGLTLYIASPPVSFAEIVRERGFFGPDDHPYAYRLLKKSAIREFKKDWLTPRGKDTLTFFTGMRSSESGRRMAHGAKDRLEERIWWVNPIRHFSSEEKWDYIRERGLPVNPVSEALGKSGECNCGCFAYGPVDKEILRELDSALIEDIEALEAELKAKGHRQWQWGRGGGKQTSCACVEQEELAL